MEVKVEEFTHLVQRYYTCKQPEDPLTRVHLSPDVVLLKMPGQYRQMAFDQNFNNTAVFVHSGQSRQINVPHVTVLY